MSEDRGLVLITGGAGLVGSRLASRIARGEFVMRGDGSGSWPYVHVDSLVETVVTAAQIARAVGHAYNMVDGQMTGKAYLDRLCQLLGVDPLTPRGEIVPWRGHYSGAKAERDLGYRPRVSYEEAMVEIERYLAQVGLLKKPGGGRRDGARSDAERGRT